jgi:hypothetical protein
MIMSMFSACTVHAGVVLVPCLASSSLEEKRWSGSSVYNSPRDETFRFDSLAVTTTQIAEVHFSSDRVLLSVSVLVPPFCLHLSSSACPAFVSPSHLTLQQFQHQLVLNRNFRSMVCVCQVWHQTSVLFSVACRTFPLYTHQSLMLFHSCWRM